MFSAGSLETPGRDLWAQLRALHTPARDTHGNALLMKQHSFAFLDFLVHREGNLEVARAHLRFHWLIQAAGL